MRPPVLLGNLARQGVRPKAVRDALDQLREDGDVLAWTDGEGRTRVTHSDPDRLAGLLETGAVTTDRLRQLQARLADRADPPRERIGAINGVIADE
jgi:hypothetical protein